ncbi:MaoC family dehydratase N-terminal domain-containing protein [Chloroflexota bacterium]
MSYQVDDVLKAMIGEVSQVLKSNDDVNKAMIRHWCEALEDNNPLYTDEGYSKKSEYGSIIMPPAMVQSHCLPVMWPKKQTPPDPLAKAMKICTEAGYSAIVGISISYEFYRPLYPGDQIRYRIKLANASSEKTTKLGQGYFVTSEYSYTNQNGEAISTQFLTVLAYKPSDRNLHNEEVVHGMGNKVLG